MPAWLHHQSPRSSLAETMMERLFPGGNLGRLDTLTVPGVLTAFFWDQ